MSAHCQKGLVFVTILISEWPQKGDPIDVSIVSKDPKKWSCFYMGQAGKYSEIWMFHGMTPITSVYLPGKKYMHI